MGALVLKTCTSCHPSSSCPVELATNAPRSRRNPAAREGRQRRQEDQVDGANEHQPWRSAHRQLQLEYPRLSEPGCSSGGAYKHLLHLRLVLLLVVLVFLNMSLAHDTSSPRPLSPVNRTTLATTRSSMQDSKHATSPRSGRIERPAARGKGRRAGAGRRPGCCRRTR